jgi:hypothetical protein
MPFIGIAISIELTVDASNARSLMVNAMLKLGPTRLAIIHPL